MNAIPAVDHFIPWSRYSVDLAHNFVLAHPSCNSSKSDFLAATPHLERWIKRNNENKDFFQSEFDQLKLPHDLNASIHVARWAYEQAEISHALVWLRVKELSPIDAGWRQLFK